MLRTIIEHNVNGTSWEPAYPLWFGEPTDPIFFYGTEVDLIPALIDSGVTVVTDYLPEYKSEDINIDGTADWYYADIQELLDSPVAKERRVLKGMLEVLKALINEDKCCLEHFRVAFYKPLLLDIR